MSHILRRCFSKTVSPGSFLNPVFSSSYQFNYNVTPQLLYFHGMHTLSPEKEMRLFGKLISFNSPTIRTDKVIRKGLNISQQEFEKAFYSHLFSVNGIPLLKKSAPLKVGDIIDMVVKEDGEKIFGKRVIVLDNAPKGESFEITLRCFRCVHQLHVDVE